MRQGLSKKEELLDWKDAERVRRGCSFHWSFSCVLVSARGAERAESAHATLPRAANLLKCDASSIRRRFIFWTGKVLHKLNRNWKEITLIWTIMWWQVVHEKVSVVFVLLTSDLTSTVSAVYIFFKENRLYIYYSCEWRSSLLCLPN